VCRYTQKGASGRSSGHISHLVALAIESTDLRPVPHAKTVRAVRFSWWPCCGVLTLWRDRHSELGVCKADRR
jgi:hypothetical protein